MKRFNDNIDKIYCVLLIIYILGLIFGTNFVYAIYIPGIIIKLLKFPLLILCIYKILFIDYKKYNNNTIVYGCLILFLLLITAFISKNSSLLQLFVIVCASYNIDFKKTLEKVFVVQTIIIFLIIFLSVIKVLPDWLYYRDNSDIVRHSFGFQYSSYISIFCFTLTSYYLYLIRDKIKIYEVLLLIILNTIAYICTNTRFPFLLSICMILVCYAIKLFLPNIKKKKEIKKILSKFLPIFTVFIVFVIIIFSYMYDKNNSFFVKANDLLSNRLVLGKQAFDEYGITLFGTKIDGVGMAMIHERMNDGKQFFVLDSTYLETFFNHGVIIFFLVCYALIKINSSLLKKGDYYLLAIFLIIETYSIFDPIIFRIHYCMFALLFVNVFIKNRPVKREIGKGNFTIDDIHKIHKKMIKSFDNYCNKNKLNYYICGGTLLGAIRHKGFIPWDDDVDILMPRKDFEKIQALVKQNNNKINSKLLLSSLNNKTSNLPFMKLYNLDYIVEEEYIDLNSKEYLWLDIFPMDGLSENEEDNIKLYKKIKFLRKLLAIRLLREEIVISSSKTKLKALLKPFLKFTIDLFPVSFYSKLINKNSQKYSFEKSKYVGGVMWGYGPQEKLLRKDVEKRVKVDFAGMKLYTFSCWDEYLTNLYGDYMKLPPLVDRSTHLVSIRKATEDEEENNR